MSVATVQVRSGGYPFRQYVALVLWCAALLSGACASAPVAAPVVTPGPRILSWEEKLDGIVRLEDERALRDEAPIPAPGETVGTEEPFDLLRLLDDSEARVRRRAALAAGRVGLPAAIEPLTRLLSSAEPEPEVRQMAAFALGLIGEASARPALTAALSDPDPIVQGRAAEALGAIGDRQDAAAVAAMAQAHIRAGAIALVYPDDLTYPLSPPIEAVRLGLYALVRLGDYAALAATVLDGEGRPISGWWPVAYALQREADPRSEAALLSLLQVPGRLSAAFAARGLGLIKSAMAVGPLGRIVEARTADPAVVVQAVRALGAIGSQTSMEVLEQVMLDQAADQALRLEALTAFGAIATSDARDRLLDLLADPDPPFRAQAMRILAQLDPESFVAALSGLDPDRDWRVRSAQAAALGTLPPDQSLPRLTVMLEDRDQRVVPAVLDALVASKAPTAADVIRKHLEADDFAVRAAAARGLAELGITDAVPQLIALYRSPGDRTYIARAAALAAVAQLDRAAARPVLEEALGDREWAVRVRAEALLREMGVSDALAARPAPSRPVDSAARRALLNPVFSPHAFIDTDRGTVEIELAILDAPLTVEKFIMLARNGFFTGVAIHRVVLDFVVQDGDPRGDGEGGPGWTVRDEINQRPYLRGTVGMALDWGDTGGSQFFITHSPQPHLDGRYTVFGHVVEGMDVVDRLRVSDIIRGVRIRDGVSEP